MEQNRKYRNKPTTIWWINLQQSRKEYPMGKRKSLQQMLVGKLVNYVQKNGTRLLSYTIQKNKIKVD